MTGASWPSTSVCALAPSGRIADAVALQRRPAEVVLDYRGPLSVGLDGAMDSGMEWVWLLDGSAVPTVDALDRLIAATDRLEGLPNAALLTGLTIDPAGRVYPPRAPWYRRAPTEAAMEAAERRLLPVRAASGSVLMRRRVLDTCRPRGGVAAESAVLEWTARILREQAGYCVPQSQSVHSSEKLSVQARWQLARGLAFGGAFGGLDRGRVLLELWERRPVSWQW